MGESQKWIEELASSSTAFLPVPYSNLKPSSTFALRMSTMNTTATLISQPASDLISFTPPRRQQTEDLLSSSLPNFLSNRPGSSPRNTSDNQSPATSDTSRAQASNSTADPAGLPQPTRLFPLSSPFTAVNAEETTREDQAQSIQPDSNKLSYTEKKRRVILR